MPEWPAISTICARPRATPLHRLDQRRQLGVASVEAFGDAQPIRHVARGKDEIVGWLGPPRRRQRREIVGQAGGALVALLGILGEQLHHQPRQRFGNLRIELVRRPGQQR